MNENWATERSSLWPRLIPAASGRVTVAVGSRREGGSRGGPGGRSKCRGAVAEGLSVLPLQGREAVPGRWSMALQ
jgi:hypothetical protein